MSNLNKAKPVVSCLIGGVQRPIVFDWWAFSVIEEERGAEFFRSLANMTMSKLLFLLWAGLLRSCPELDGVTPAERRAGQRKVAQWCSDGTDISAVTEAVNQALANSAVDAGGEEKNAVSAQAAEEASK